MGRCASTVARVYLIQSLENLEAIEYGLRMIGTKTPRFNTPGS